MIFACRFGEFIIFSLLQQKGKMRPCYSKMSPDPSPGISFFRWPINKKGIISGLVDRLDPFPCCPGKKAGAEAKKGWELPSRFPLFVSANGNGGKGTPGRKRRKLAMGKEESPPFLARRMLFCPGMGPFGNRELSGSAETNENASLSERNRFSFQRNWRRLLKFYR